MTISWRTGSASGSSSEGCVFNPRQGHCIPLLTFLSADAVFLILCSLTPTFLRKYCSLQIEVAKRQPQPPPIRNHLRNNPFLHSGSLHERVVSLNPVRDLLKTRQKTRFTSPQESTGRSWTIKGRFLLNTSMLARLYILCIVHVLCMLPASQ